MKYYITITILLIITLINTGQIFSEKLDFNLWYMNDISRITRLKRTAISEKRIISISQDSSSVHIGSKIFQTSSFSLSSQFNLYEGYCSSGDIYQYPDTELFLKNHITANISLKAFDDYYFSVYSSYGKSMLSTNFEESVFIGFYGIGLEKYFTDSILMSLSYNTYYYSAYSIPWDYKHQEKKILDLMLKMIF